MEQDKNKQEIGKKQGTEQGNLGEREGDVGGTQQKGNLNKGSTTNVGTEKE